MIIQPPNNEELISNERVEITEDLYDRVQQFLDCKPWKCPNCGLTNFGRNEFCADYKCRIARPI